MSSVSKDESRPLNLLASRIVSMLANLAAQTQEIETRVFTLRSIGLIIESLPMTSGKTSRTAIQSLLPALAVALDDYTINERGDIGSLVRLEGLLLIDKCWQQEIDYIYALTEKCTSSLYRLALEKLDRVRLQAATVLMKHRKAPFDGTLKYELSAFSLSFISITNLGRHFPLSQTLSLTDVSSYIYYSLMTSLFHCPSITTSVTPSLLCGLALSASPTSTLVAEPSRSALISSIEHLPTFTESRSASLTSVTSLASTLQGLLLANLPGTPESDRLTTPLLDLSSLFLDAGVLQRLSSTSMTNNNPDISHNSPQFKPRTFLSTIQKSHYQSTNIPRLLAAISVYRGLSSVSSIRADVIAKLVGMLSHPFPKVRIAAAETLWLVTEDEALLSQDWSGVGKVNRREMERLKWRLCAF